MKYPKLISKGSTLYPKLLGSYESELHSTILTFQNNDYTEILDVGCAEGFYAVGMAMNFKFTKLYAFDSDPCALIACEEMAKENNVHDRIITRGGLDSQTLSSFTFQKRGLIICDCEGYEKELFTKENIHNLTSCDLIIETHDLFDIEISTYLIELFKDTHTIETILSTDDINKAIDSQYTELEHLSLIEKKKLLAEECQAIMKWLICRPITDT